MNVLEYDMIETLKRLKGDYGVFQIKAEYENEGSREVELMRLKDITSSVGLPIILKIGGVEAVSDMYQALTLGAQGIIAPMAETAFAASKFLDAVSTFIPSDNQEDIELAINIETITAYHNCDRILALPNINLLDSVTIGRVDFVSSLGKNRTYVDADSILQYCTKISQRVRAKGLKCGIGGSISFNSATFLKTLIDEGLISKYETRKVVYHKDAISKIKDGLTEGIKFELQWLKSKSRYYHRVAIEDKKRIEMIEERLKNA